MSRNYKFHNPEGLYFVSFAVINWIDVFTRNEYKDIFLDTVRHAMDHKKINVFSWCIMTNHVHLVFNVPDPFKPGLVLGDIKRFSGKKIMEAIQTNPRESRKEWMMQQFHEAAQQSSNTTRHQFWRHDNHPVELWSNAVIREKISYIHNNPVEAGFVAYPKDYLYSSAMDYSGEKGLRGVEVLDQMYDWKRIKEFLVDSVTTRRDSRQRGTNKQESVMAGLSKMLEGSGIKLYKTQTQRR